MGTQKMYDDLVNKYNELLRFTTKQSVNFDNKTKKEYTNLLNKHCW
jgi:hypothetical protein